MISLLRLFILFYLDSVIETAFRKQEYGTKKDDKIVKEKSLLHKVNWHRIVLDEAHNIKDRSCNTARSVVKSDLFIYMFIYLYIFI